MTSYGHVKLSRKLFDGDSDPLWSEPRVFSRFEAWVDILQLAAYKPRSVQYQHETIELARGEFIMSVRYCARRYQWSEKFARKFLKWAQDQARIRAQGETQAGMRYVVVNYDTYQSTPRKTDTPSGTGLGTGSGTEGAQGGHSTGTINKQLSRESTEKHSSSSSARSRFLAAAETTGRIGWRETLAGWEQGVGYVGGKAADPVDIEAGVAEYMADNPDPTFSPRHVVKYVAGCEARRRQQASAPVVGESPSARLKRLERAS